MMHTYRPAAQHTGTNKDSFSCVSVLKASLFSWLSDVLYTPHCSVISVLQLCAKIQQTVSGYKYFVLFSILYQTLSNTLVLDKIFIYIIQL